jgi:hypothetical protein
MAGRSRSRQDGARRKLEADLDKALAQTFPASDPYSIGHFTSTEPPSRSIDHKPPEPVVEPRRPRRRSSKA